MNPFVSNGNKLKWKFENVKELDENGRFSDKFEIRPTKWKINVRKNMENDVKYLAVFFYYAGDNANEKQWICQTNRTMKLINQSENGKDVFATSSMCYSNNSDTWGYPKLYKWDDLMKDGYMKNDSIIIDVDFSFKYYDFSKNIPNLTDITFKVEDIEFHTSKAVLCMQSEYFYDLFINKKHEETVIEIEDVNLDDFRFFLASFYPLFESVEDKNYGKLIELAEKYKVPTLHKNCEQYLLKDVKISLEKKLEYADKYDYYDLMKHCIQSLDNAQKIKNIQKSVEFHNFKESTKLMIMTRILDFY
ncbi:unnamed protein product [Caenorhabditis angaria]|uniref:BTB domain-containing protein n=1 Tax=Caenorhabditis angaria TaxID=860376 RepID=A0A9P1MVG4_9PELO|nr:unnamed protein product [Caenorhabditis angaria]